MEKCGFAYKQMFVEKYIIEQAMKFFEDTDSFDFIKISVSKNNINKLYKEAKENEKCHY